MNIVEPFGRDMRWRLSFVEFIYTAKYRKSAHNTQVDIISRPLTTGEALL